MFFGLFICVKITQNNKCVKKYFKGIKLKISNVKCFT